MRWPWSQGTGPAAAAASGGAACVRVPDLEMAVTYYRQVLSFEQIALLGAHQPQFAVMRKHGALLLLQRDPAYVRRTLATDAPGPPWDALLLVDDVEGVHHDLSTRGVHALSDVDDKNIGWESFDFQDCCGNVVCVGQRVDGLFDSAGSRSSGLLQRALLWRARKLSRRQEDALFRRFQNFYQALPEKQDVFFMFFTSDLLHWVARAESFVPDDVNLVLLGSALHDDEKQWIREHLSRPFHAIDLPIDDATAWEFIFRASEHNFGWVDIDCFVLNPGLFAELTRIESQTSMNCTWSWDPGYGFPVANTHLLFLNAEAIRALEARHVSTAPGLYDWNGTRRRFPGRACFMNVPDERQQALMLEVLPPDPQGRPRMIEGDFFNTLVVYQVLARAMGYSIHRTRPLARRCGEPVDAHSTDPQHWPEDMSDELFHMFGISYYRRHDYAPGVRHLYLDAEYTMLSASADVLPQRYAALRDLIAEELTAAELPLAAAADRVRRHLVESRKVSRAAADRILAPRLDARTGISGVATPEDPGRADAPPDQAIAFAVLTEIIGGLCGTDPSELKPDTPVASLAIDSLTAGEVIAQTERALQIEIDFQRGLSEDWSTLDLGALAALLAAAVRREPTP